MSIQEIRRHFKLINQCRLLEGYKCHCERSEAISILFSSSREKRSDLPPTMRVGIATTYLLILGMTTLLGLYRSIVIAYSDPRRIA